MTEKKTLILKIKKLKIKDFSLKKLREPKVRNRIIFTLLILFICFLGILVGAYKAIMQNLPSIAMLETYEPPIITYVYADNGEVIGEYARQKRIVITYEKIPEVLKKAIIATEDPRFYRHHGIDFYGILRAVKENIKIGRKSRRLHGGSTISQQLSRELFLHPKQTIRRKLKEVILALQIERKYTKQQIMTMYCNQYDLGHGAFGVETASQLFFEKNVSELTLTEAAMIAGLFRGPYYYSPYNNPERTLRRRNHVLNRMVEEGFLRKDEAEKIKQEPLNVLPLYRGDSEFSAYFNEEVRKYLEKNYGAETLYRDGLKVYTTVNIEYQKYAEEALRNHLKVLDKRQGWRKDKRNLLDEGVQNLEEFHGKTFSSWLKSSLEEQDIIEAVVLSVERNKATIKFKDYTGKLTNKGIGWTKTNNPKNLIKKGDVIHVKIQKIDEENKKLDVSLDQEPLLEGGFLAIEPQTGQIKAMVGGYSFERSKWNNATQATRQSGSVIKPILYTAALENGFTPASRIVDEPTEFEDQWSGELYAPNNYDRKYKGAVTLRTGLEESRNIVTAKLLEYISPQIGVEYCKRFGIKSPVYPYLSLALGAFEARLIELVSAFTTFPNRGIRVKPYFITRIEDKDGNILEESKIETEEVISPEIAYMMTYLLQGVVQKGTAAAASFLLKDKPLAGKTGTTDEYSDAWFIGFSPSLCAGVWVGHNTKISIGEHQSGAVAALPVWIDFFSHIIEKEKKVAEEMGEDSLMEEFEVPPNLNFVEIDRKTGLLATPFCLWTMKEVFLPGTEPGRFCTYEDHLLVLDYYSKKKEEIH